MDSRQDSDIDDDFSELYKEYTGPLRPNETEAQDKTMTNKRPHTGSDEEEEAYDPNAVPTDFTSREAKVWEAKSKATERIWKKRKEEEMICKICGESGHFTQGCPSTLGTNRKSQDFFERVPARERYVKALFTEKVINQIEKGVGCKIKMEERFIIVSGKDRLILRKGVDAVHKVKEESEKKGPSSSKLSRSRSPEQKSPVRSRLAHSDSQRSNHSPHNASQLYDRYRRQDKVVEDYIRDDFKNSRDSSQVRAYGNGGTRGRSSYSRSPARSPYLSNSYNPFGGPGQSRGDYRSDGWDADTRGSNIKSSRSFDPASFSHSFEDLELEFRKDAADLGRIRDDVVDDEKHKHLETKRVNRENYMKKLAILRGEHAKQWEGFLQVDASRQQKAHQHISGSGFGGFNQPSYPEYENSANNPHYSGPSLPMDSRARYPSPMENYPPTREHDHYGDFQRHMRDDLGKAYN